MQTDKEFLRIFQSNPDLLKEFLGIEMAGPCTLRSQTLKSLERRVDGVLEFVDRDPVVFVEIQVIARMLSMLGRLPPWLSFILNTL